MGNGQYFGELSFSLSQDIGYWCFYSSPYWISIVFYEYHIVGIKSRCHGGARHLVPYNQSLLLFSFDSQKDLISYFANSGLVIHVDTFWWSVVWCVPQGTVVHHSHTSELLYCSGCSSDTRKRQERMRQIFSIILGEQGQTQHRILSLHKPLRRRQQQTQIIWVTH